jgi:hypothetical protein
MEQMDRKYEAELQLRNLSGLMSQLKAEDVPASLTLAGRIREVIESCADEHKGHLLAELECMVAKLNKMAHGE